MKKNINLRIRSNNMMKNWKFKVFDTLMSIPICLFMFSVVFVETITNIIELLPFACVVFCPIFLISYFWVGFTCIIWFLFIFICLLKSILYLHDAYNGL